MISFSVKKICSRRSYCARSKKALPTSKLLLLGLLLTAATLTLQETMAEENTSLDSMWIDQDAPTIDNDNVPKASGTETSSSTGSAGTVASAGGVPSIVAPMCSLDEFRASPFVSKGSWPGMGPFKSSGDDISDMSDASENRLKVNVKNEQITSAQLGIGKLGSGHVRDFLDIEMASDFLLESLGAKARKIAEFNKQLEKNKNALKPGAKPWSQAAGRYQITIDRSKSAQPYSCQISVNSLDANKNIIAEHSGSPANDEPVEEKKPEAKHPIIEAIKKPLPKPKPSAPNINPAVDPKKEEFVATIKSWQQIKKVALKKRDPSHLNEILNGTALAKQSTAVKWLQTHGNYYDMEPRGCAVDKYTDMGGGKKYSVIAQVREFSKYIRESDNAVLKEVDDKYTVNYTLEKVNDKWMITDSAVVNTGQSNTGSAAKPGAKAH